MVTVMTRTTENREIFLEGSKYIAVGWLKSSDYKKKKFCKHNIDQFARQATNHET